MMNTPGGPPTERVFRMTEAVLEYVRDAGVAAVRTVRNDANALPETQLAFAHDGSRVTMTVSAQASATGVIVTFDAMGEVMAAMLPHLGRFMPSAWERFGATDTQWQWRVPITYATGLPLPPVVLHEETAEIDLERQLGDDFKGLRERFGPQHDPGRQLQGVAGYQYDGSPVRGRIHLTMVGLGHVSLLPEEAGLEMPALVRVELTLVCDNQQILEHAVNAERFMAAHGLMHPAWTEGRLVCYYAL